MRSEKEKLAFALARTMSAEVIADVGKAQAANALLSEAQCLEIGDASFRELLPFGVVRRTRRDQRVCRSAVQLAQDHLPLVASLEL